MPYKPHYNRQFGDLGFEVSQRWPERTIIKNKGKREHTLGLALSGGGYRSAIFSYGVLQGLHELRLLNRVDYLSVVSGGSWIGTPLSVAEDLEFFFYKNEETPQPNFMEEGFESLLPNVNRLAQEVKLARRNSNFVSNVYGRLLARTFLREHGDFGRTEPLGGTRLIRDNDRPFLIINGTANFRRPDSFDVTQECFEMTRLYCGSRSLGYTSSSDFLAKEVPLRIRDAIAVSGAAVAIHMPGLRDDVAGIGLGREITNYAIDQANAPANVPPAEEIDLADGGHYNNLGVESLISRGCGYVIIVDGEHDPEDKDARRSNQRYHGLKTLLGRMHIRLPEISVAALDRANVAVNHIQSEFEDAPDVLYIKLKSSTEFDRKVKGQPYNEPSFLENLFRRGEFSFDPQFSTAKLDYDFAEHRNLSELGRFFVEQNRRLIGRFVSQSR